jgi:5'-3' exonuclease
MLQDMIQCVQYSQQIVFTLGQPFTPFQQLLGCLPPASATLVPKPYAWLMCSIESPVLEFYPTEFSIDADGKKNPWEAVGKIHTVHTIQLINWLGYSRIAYTVDSSTYTIVVII